MKLTQLFITTLLLTGIGLPVQAQSTQLNCDSSQITEIKLIPNSGDKYEFFISGEPRMPTMKFTVDLVGELLTDELKACLNSKLQTSFDWNVKVEYWDGIYRDQHKILPAKLGAQRRGLTSKDGWQYAATNKSGALTIGQTELGDTFGGGADGSVSVTLNLSDRKLTATLPLNIWAASVDKTDMKLYLGSLEYQLLGYLESKFIHIYNGTPLLNCGDATCSVSDGGFGLMQMTDCGGVPGAFTSMPGKSGNNHGYPSYLQVWNWQANAAAGKACYDNKVRFGCGGLAAGSDAQLKCGYSRYNGSNSYGELGMTILNEMRDGRFRAGWF